MEGEKQFMLLFANQIMGDLLYSTQSGPSSPCLVIGHDKYWLDVVFGVNFRC
ncbi:MAG: hypothetical protein Q6366_012885 [Candidatus Freyarchaeota archaeon]